MNRLVNTSIVTAAASLSLLGAGAAHASSGPALDRMMDACIQQFVADNLAGYPGKVTVRKEEFSHGSSLVAGQSNYRITVAAVGRASGAQLASATCEMSHDGSVVSIKSVPLAALKQIQRVEPEVVANNDAE